MIKSRQKLSAWKKCFFLLYSNKTSRLQLQVHTLIWHRHRRSKENKMDRHFFVRIWATIVHFMYYLDSLLWCIIHDELRDYRLQFCKKYFLYKMVCSDLKKRMFTLFDRPSKNYQFYFFFQPEKYLDMYIIWFFHIFCQIVIV